MNTKNIEELMQNKYYVKYKEQKEKIKEKYDCTTFPCHDCEKGYKVKSSTKEQQEQYREYLKEIGDLIFKKRGNFQKFIWDIIPEWKLQEQERRARGASIYSAKGKGTKFNYY